VNPSERAGLAFGMAVASFVMTVCGFFWLGWAITVARFETPMPWPLLYGVFLVLLAAAIHSVRKAKALVTIHVNASDPYWPARRRQFHTITGLEGAACAIAVALAISLHRPDLIAMGISLVVGLHFFPLGRLFHVPAYYAVGTAIVACDVLAWVFLRFSATTVSVGLSTGAILWALAVYALLRSRRNTRAIVAR
jgi:hypothetical protein